jgi:hypothetical protein
LYTLNIIYIPFYRTHPYCTFMLHFTSFTNSHETLSVHSAVKHYLSIPSLISSTMKQCNIVHVFTHIHTVLSRYILHIIYSIVLSHCTVHPVQTPYLFYNSSVPHEYNFHEISHYLHTAWKYCSSMQFKIQIHNKYLSYSHALACFTSQIRSPSPYMFFSPCAVRIHSVGGRGRCRSGGGWDR